MSRRMRGSSPSLVMGTGKLCRQRATHAQTLKTLVDVRSDPINGSRNSDLLFPPDPTIHSLPASLLSNIST
eukprot:2280095-Rhodomonas_salina.1